MVGDDAAKSVESSDGGGTPKFCQLCHYPLHGLQSAGKCPECGRNYDVNNHATFTYDSQPLPAWKSQLSRRRRIVIIIALVAIGHPILSLGGGLLFLIYPVWIMLLCFYLLDVIHRLFRVEPDSVALLIGFAVGLGIGWFSNKIYDIWIGEPFAWISGGLGGLAAILLIAASIGPERDT